LHNHLYRIPPLRMICLEGDRGMNDISAEHIESEKSVFEGNLSVEAEIERARTELLDLGA